MRPLRPLIILWLSPVAWSLYIPHTAMPQGEGNRGVENRKLVIRAFLTIGK
jgi:hypothetical protein